MKIELKTQNEESENFHSVVAKLNGKGVGYGAARVRSTELEIKNIIVDRRARQKGVGETILTDLEEWGISHEAESAWSDLVPISSSMKELEHFFLKHGYQIIFGYAEKKPLSKGKIGSRNSSE